MSEPGASPPQRVPTVDRRLAALLQALAGAAETWPAGAVVVGLSGGPDSSALLLALHHLGRAVHAVHVAHHLREGAVVDEQAARSLCAALGIPFRVLHVDGHALARDDRGWEAAARVARYAALAEAATQIGATQVLTAHTAQDRLETLWRGLASGGGLRALQGPLACRPLRATVSLVRPLLGWFRADVERVLQRLAPPGWQAAVDPSNADPRRDRARVRPALRALAESESPVAMARALARLQTSAQLLDTFLNAAWDTTVIPRPERVGASDLERGAETAATSQFSPPAAIAFQGAALRAQPPLVRQELVLRACHAVGGRPSEAFVAAAAALVDGPGRRARDGEGLYATWRDGVLTVSASSGRGSDRMNPTADRRHRYR